MKLVFLSQAPDLSGYAQAAKLYIAALDAYLTKHPGELELKTLGVSFENKNNSSDQALFSKYEFSSLAEANKFADTEDFILVWHMCPATLPWALDKWLQTDPAWQTVLRLFQKAKSNLNLSTWEADKIPQFWNNIFSSYGTSACIVPSTWNVEVYKKCGAPPTFCLPHVLDFKDLSEETEPVDLGNILKDKFTILSVSQWINRKCHEKLIKAFYCEFGRQKNVALVIKTYGVLMKEFAVSQQKQAQMIASEINQWKNSIFMDDGRPPDTNIVLISDVISRPQMNDLYSRADVFALATKGEGFGLTIAEAAMHGLPIIAPDYGGYKDFIGPFLYPISGSLEPFEARPEYSSQSMSWFEPSVASIRKQLREAYNSWKAGILKKQGNYNRNKIKSLNWTYEEIGRRFIEILKETNSPEKTEKNLSTISQTTRSLKNKISKLPTLEEKVAALKDAYKGESAYLLSCGPSLNDFSAEELKEKLKGKFVATVKQAIIKYPDADCHFYNCCNLPPPNVRGEHYSYNPFSEPLIIASSNYAAGLRWHPNQKYDLFFKIPTRLETNKVLSVEQNFDDCMFDKQVERSYIGPGCFYETVIPMLVWLGFKDITLIGHDLAPISNGNLDKNKLTNVEYHHFYPQNVPLVNAGDMMQGEMVAAIESSQYLYQWLMSRGVDLKIAYRKTPSFLWSGIPRVQL